GAVLRCAAALGVGGAGVSPGCADPLYRRSVRVSMGAVFSVPYARAVEWPDAIDELRASGLQTVALTPAADADDLREVGSHPIARLAVVFGSAGPGLSTAVFH